MLRPPAILPSTQFKINRALWLMTAALLALDAALMHVLGWQTHVPAAADFLVVMVACAALSLVTRFMRDDSLCLFGHAINQIIITGGAIECFSYLGASLNLPLWDAPFLAADRWLGFDWQAYIDWVEAHAAVAQFLTISYQSFGPQMILYLCALFLYGYAGHAQRFLMAMLASALIFSILGALFPALGMFGYAHIDPALYPHLNSAGGSTYLKTLSDLRDHSVTALSFPMTGIVMFPSFHTALAIILTYAARPFRWIRPWAIVLNAGMLFSTPVDGGHYLIDVVAGTVVAWLAIHLARWLLPSGIAP
jgi:membrane-associated phospholipid phosphatase